MDLNKNKNVFCLLEQLLNENLGTWNKQSAAIKNYVYQHYIYFASKRSEIFSKLTKSLLANCNPFEFKSWQCIISYKYSLEPLSARGSMNHPAGGRFNIGNIDRKIFPRFGAIYLAEDRESAIRERYGLVKKSRSKGALSLDEFNLIQKSSETAVVVSAKLNVVLDLSNVIHLRSFFLI